MLFTPFCKALIFLFSAAKEKNASLWILGNELFDDLMRQTWRIGLSFMSRKGGYTYPLLIVLLDPQLLWQHVQVATLLREDALKLYLHRITQFGEDINIVLERGGLLHQFLVRC